MKLGEKTAALVAQLTAGSTIIQERLPLLRRQQGVAPQTSLAWIQIEGDRLIEGEIDDDEFGPVLRAGESEWLLFRSEKDVGRRARRFMADLARHDPEEFARLMGGEEVLARWTLGRPAGPGTAKVRSLKAYLDLWLTDFAALFDVDPQPYPIKDYPIELEGVLGFKPGVAYRRVELVA